MISGRFLDLGIINIQNDACFKSVRPCVGQNWANYSRNWLCVTRCITTFWYNSVFAPNYIKFQNKMRERNLHFPSGAHTSARGAAGSNSRIKRAWRARRGPPERGPRGIKITLFRQLRTYAKYAPALIMSFNEFLRDHYKAAHGELCVRSHTCDGSLSLSLSSDRHTRECLWNTARHRSRRALWQSAFTSRARITQRTRDHIIFRGVFSQIESYGLGTDKWSRHVSRC